ncbi:MAG: hypothetical protein U7126_02780 [Microcoleus sp.]
MFKVKFRKAIEKYIATTFPIEASRAKGVITRTVNTSTESNTLELIKEVLAEFDHLPDWIKNRFTPGSLYREGDSVFGWYRDNQVQAEAMPVDIPLTCQGYLKVLVTRDGFIESVPLPLSNGCEVCVPHQYAFTYAKYGYANACSLQWHRDAQGYHVDRSIIPHVFWQAWKWWEGAWHWYLERRPELFEDFECWGEPTPDYRIEPGSTVIGNKK